MWIWISHGVNIFFPESLSLNNNLANYIENVMQILFTLMENIHCDSVVLPGFTAASSLPDPYPLSESIGAAITKYHRLGVL